MSGTDRLDPEVRVFMTALRDLLDRAPHSWAAGSAVSSLNMILTADTEGCVDWDREAEFLRARQAEVERA